MSQSLGLCKYARDLYSTYTQGARESNEWISKVQKEKYFITKSMQLSQVQSRDSELHVGRL